MTNDVGFVDWEYNKCLSSLSVNTIKLVKNKLELNKTICLF